MRFCAKCGFQNADGASFCTKCGAILNLQKAPTLNEQVGNTTERQKYYDRQPMPQVEQIKPAVESHEVIAEIKKIGSSKKMLFASIFFTASIAIGIIATIYAGSTIINLLGLLIIMLGFNATQVASIATLITSFFIIGVIVVNIPSLLNALGVWITYGSCSKKHTNYISTAGLSLIRALKIIALVFLYIGLFSLIGWVGYSVIMLFTSGHPNAMSLLPKYMITLAVGCAVLILPIIYYSKLIKTIDTIRKCAWSGLTATSISQFVVVINYLIGVGFIISAIVSGFKLQYLSIVLNLLNAISIFIFTTLLSDFKHIMGFLQLKNTRRRNEAEQESKNTQQQSAPGHTTQATYAQPAAAQAAAAQAATAQAAAEQAAAEQAAAEQAESTTFEQSGANDDNSNDNCLQDNASAAQFDDNTNSSDSQQYLNPEDEWDQSFDEDDE